jgi:hypothetical protein
MTAKAIGRTEAITFGLIVIAFLAILGMSGCNLPQRGARAQGGGGAEDGTQNCPTREELQKTVDDINRNSKYFKVEPSNLKFGRPPRSDGEQRQPRSADRGDAPVRASKGEGDDYNGGFTGYAPSRQSSKRRW